MDSGIYCIDYAALVPSLADLPNGLPERSLRAGTKYHNKLSAALSVAGNERSAPSNQALPIRPLTRDKSRSAELTTVKSLCPA